MTNDEARMTKECRSTNDNGRARCPQRAPGWNERVLIHEDGAQGLTRPTFGLRHSLVIRALSFVIAVLLSTITYQLSTPTALAQSAINWHTIDGGGGTSTGGVYSVSGTIGQHEAGSAMTNGQYSVTGGFWALPTAIQVTGAPTLTIVPATPGNATIAWSPNTPGYILQQTALLSPSNWTNSLSGSTNPINVSATNASKFYRLFKP